jgi:[calcium/calmodulin-dependent protein kinase] kinase
VQETLNARSEYSNSEDDGTAQHRINQYLIKQEIGRGSFGAVHLAVDQYGQEYVRIHLVGRSAAMEDKHLEV